MSEHGWQPVSADRDRGGFELIYRNERGEEYLHAADHFGVGES